MTGMALIQRSLEPGALEAFEILEKCSSLEAALDEERFVLWLMAELKRRIEE